MASVNTNVAAITALRTLQNTNKQLDATQNRISTGYKISEAKDNAAYWSISTTLKSDNKALSTVKDALSLGASTVDTAYQGLNKAKDVLDAIKSKITAASQDGVDKTAIQDEISQLQDQLKSIATSSTFSGENWLSVNSAASGYSASKSVVAGMNRDASGNATLSTISIDTSSFVLTNGNSSAEGILDAGKSGNTQTGGLKAMASAATGTGSSGKSSQGTDYAYTASDAADKDPAAETLQIGLTIDGTKTFSFTLTGSSNFDSAAHLAAAINSQIGSAGLATVVSNKLVITSATEGTSSSVDLTTATFTGSGTAGNPTGAVAASMAGFVTTSGGSTEEVKTTGNASAASTTMAAAFTGTVITLDSNDKITFSIAANGNDAKTVTIDRDTVIAALGSASAGKIASAADYATVIQKALTDNGVANITVGTDTGAIKLTSTVEGSGSSINISTVDVSKGQSILDIDVTNATDEDLTSYLNAVSDAISKVTSAASTLGAVSSRIDLQQSFVDTLMDTIDKGVSGLIDADMSEESTKLQALQVKQQLGTQALSIANSSAQNILSLFQSNS